VSGSADNTIRLWNIENEEAVHEENTTDFITSIKISPDGQKLLVGLFKGMCFVYHIDQEK
jgi:WD40 repeat protein